HRDAGSRLRGLLSGRRRRGAGRTARAGEPGAVLSRAAACPVREAHPAVQPGARAPGSRNIAGAGYPFATTRVCCRGSAISQGRCMNDVIDAPKVRLTSFSHGGGCGCKIAPGLLSEILKNSARLPVPKELLVGIDTSDDAAVYKLNAEQALIATTDF